MFRIIGFILRFYPLVMVGVNAVEAVMSASSGEDKKKVLVNTLVKIAGSLGIKMDKARTRVLSEAIDLIVAVFNATGWFSSVEDAIEEVQEEVEEEVKKELSETDRRLQEIEDAFLR